MPTASDPLMATGQAACQQPVPPQRPSHHLTHGQQLAGVVLRHHALQRLLQKAGSGGAHQQPAGRSVTARAAV